MKKTVSLTEHILIPLALALLNMAAVHLIYLVVHQGWSLPTYTLPVSLALLLLTGSLVFKNKWLLLGSMAFYLALFLLELTG